MSEAMTEFQRRNYEHFRKELPEDSYSLTPDQIRDIAAQAVREAQGAWHWNEGMDWPVFWIGVGRYLKTGSFR